MHFADLLAADGFAGADLLGAGVIGASRIVVRHDAVWSRRIELVLAEAVSRVRTGIRSEGNADVVGDVHAAVIPQVVATQRVVVADHLATDGVIAADRVFKVGVAGGEAAAEGG